jgi:hypothetical protein
VLPGEIGVWLHHAVQAALAPGVDGWIADDIALHSPWGCAAASISIPSRSATAATITSYHSKHGRWLADSRPPAQAELRDDDGHFKGRRAQRIADVHGWLEQYT